MMMSSAVKRHWMVGNNDVQNYRVFFIVPKKRLRKKIKKYQNFFQTVSPPIND